MAKNKYFGGENIYYHVFNRGVEKRDIFLDTRDYNRFIFLTLLLQSESLFNNAYRLARLFDEHQMFIMEEIEVELKTTRAVELVSFVLMPNHFHFILREIKDAGIAKFIQRLCNSYAKYFNQKYQRTGHLFGSKYHKKLIDTNEYLLHLSAYLHRNPRELKKWENKEHQYPWSSYQDYITSNRWGIFLNSSVILDQFKNTKEYRHFVKTSRTKEWDDEMMNI